MPPREQRANENGSPAGSAPPAKKSWRGTTAADQPLARYKWQRDWTKEQDIDVKRRNMRHRMKVVAMWALFLGLTLWLAYYLIFPARLTPFVPIAVTQYDFPVPPNAYAREDVGRFKDLDSESLKIVDGTIVEEKDWNRNWRNLPDGMNRLRDLLRDAWPLASRQQVIVIYLSMHGVVDLNEQNLPRACLLPPTGGSNKEWLPVSQVFDLLATDEFKDRKKLLVLDAQRLESDWHLGQLYNGFGATFETAFKAAQVPNLAVLAAASPGEVAWSSPEMGASSFGRFFSDGLHGEADGFGPENDPDGEITLGELTDYVRTQCDAWASENRVDRQSPYLLTESSSDARDWTVAQPSSKGLLAWLENWFSPGASATPTEAPVESPADTREALADFWQDHHDLEQAGAIQLDPLAWEEFERRLLWGEQLADAGRDPNYVKFSRDNLGELTELTAQLRPQPKANPASTIPLAELLGGKPEGLAPAQVAWKLLQSGIDRSKVNATLDKLKQESPAALDFSEIQFLRLLHAYLPPDDWNNPLLVESILHLRNLAESVATPSDPRVAPWIEPGVTAADESRRLAEDRLFIGGKGQGQGPQNDAIRAEELYQRTQKLSSLMAEAYRLRDEVAAKVPHLAAWLSRRLPSALEEGTRTAYTNEFDALLKNDFQPLLESYRTFSLSILNRTDENLADVTTLDKRMQLVTEDMNTIRARFNKLQDAFNNECQDLKVLAGDNGKNDTDKLRRLAAVLSVPLIDAQERANLRANYEMISQTRANAWKAQDQPMAAAAQPDALQLIRMTAWDGADHPAISLLRAALPDKKDVDWETAGSDRFTDLARQGALLRQRLSLSMQGIDSFATSALADGISQFRQKSDLADCAQARVGFSQSDHLLRTTAAFGPAIDAQQESPIGLLQAFDRCYLLRWHARRAMDDFYGSPTTEEDYFEVAAKRYLESASSELTEFCGNDAPAMTERALLEKRQTAAAEIARFPLAAELADSSGGDIDHQLYVTPQPDLPIGQIAVFLARQGEDATRLQLVRPEIAGADSVDYRPAIPTLPNPESTDGHYELDYSIRQADPSKNELRGAKVEAVAYLRGHLSKELLLSDPLLVEFSPPPYVAPNILVTSAERKQGELMFIFDCSGSMSEPTSNNGNRIDVAKNVLFGVDDNGGVLDRLAGTGMYRVGLRVYGHRVGFDPNNPQQIRRNPAILKLFPEQVNAERYKQELERIRLGTDVDRLLPINDFSEIELKEIKKLFYSASFTAWGITPLYYSIAEAIKNDFQSGTNAADRRIVVLTDGNDQQHLDKGLPDADKMDATKLRALIKDYNDNHPGRKVKLDIVGFHVEEAPVLREIARDTGGQYFKATSPEQLLDSLEQSLGLSNYTVLPPEGKSIGPGDFGKPLSIVPSPRKRTPYKVRINKSDVETDVELEGGEAIELELTGGQLVHKRYNGDPRMTFENLFNPDTKAGPREVFLRSHQPAAQKAEERRFFISVQNQDASKFSPRPAEVWAEITPVLTTSTTPVPTYTFFDAYVEPQRPVPVLAFEVPRWPAEAREAEIKFWCKYQRTNPDHEVQVADVANQPNLPLEKRSIPKLPGVTFDVKTATVGDPVNEVAEVIVTVKQTGTARDPVKVEMIPSPVSVQHQYFDSNQSVRHRFHFEGVTQKALLDKFNRDYSVRFTSAENLKQGAITPGEPFHVDIPRD